MLPKGACEVAAYQPLRSPVISQVEFLRSVANSQELFVINPVASAKRTTNTREQIGFFPKVIDKQDLEATD
jgi:hypothetical protein